MYYELICEECGNSYYLNEEERNERNEQGCEICESWFYERELSKEEWDSIPDWND